MVLGKDYSFKIFIKKYKSIYKKVKTNSTFFIFLIVTPCAFLKQVLFFLSIFQTALKLELVAFFLMLSHKLIVLLLFGRTRYQWDDKLIQTLFDLN